MKKYFLQTFGCQMNQADSEKVHMVLLQSGFMKVSTLEEADLLIANTCSVRQKGEDRVFGMLREIEDINNSRAENGDSNRIISGITGCMVRKTGLAKRYLPKLETTPGKKRKTAKKIDLLESKTGLYNNEDKLFPRSDTLDFVFRIEETKYLPHLLSEIYDKKIGQDDKFDDYLKQGQLRENKHSASVIIQTGCDNYCSFCIVPFTRGKEISRSEDEIISECKNAVASGVKEITLLGQNVNSYGKQTKTKLWDNENSQWKKDNKKQLRIAIDLDDTLFVVLCQKMLDSYNRKFHSIIKMDDIRAFNCNGIPELMQEYHNYEERHKYDMEVHEGGKAVLKKLKGEGHLLFVITSRPPDVRSSTEELLRTNFGDVFFEEIVFIQEIGADTKYIAANRMSIDLVIDDGPHHILAYQEHYKGKTCIFTQGWNRAIPEDNITTFRVDDWSEFYPIVESLAFQTPFSRLLERIDQEAKPERIRFTSSNPHDMTYDILSSHFRLKSPCNYLHFALQSGSNQMLKKMNRKHSYEDFLSMVKYLRKKDPFFSISTDIIVGFSGETDEMFQETVKAFQECEFDFAYTARYSVRPNTLAAKVMPDDVPDSVKAERWHALNNLLLENITKRNTLMLGNTFDVLIHGEKDDMFYGRTRNFKEVFFEKSSHAQIGDLINIEMTELDRYVLKGKYA